MLSYCRAGVTVTNCLFSGIYKKDAKVRFHQRCKRRQKISVIVVIMTVIAMMKMETTSMILEIVKEKPSNKFCSL